MVLRSDELSREIAETREEMGERLVELRRRGETAARRTVRLALIAAGVGAALGAAVAVTVIAYRVSRPPTFRERVGRVVPRDLRRRAELFARRAVPSIRLYVNDEAVGERAETTTQRLVLSAARAAGTAAATALAGVALRRLTARDRA